MAPLPSPQSRTVAAIYASHLASRSTYRSAGIAVSEAGHECDRAIWYRFRWADAPSDIDGRKARLFDTGNREEVRLIAELRAIGCEVLEVDPDTGNQYLLRLADGHLRGKADGAVHGIPDAPATWHLLEAKTHSAKNFKVLASKGVATAFPKHFVQCQLGMHALGLTRALYLAACKDTDEIHAERLEYDAAFALRAEARARRIAFADTVPWRISDNPDKPPCSWCPALAVCYRGEFPAGGDGVVARNCRTCLNSQPMAGGVWHCTQFERQLTLDEQREGCPSHLWLPSLVPGDQVDASEEAQTVTYAMRDGSTFVDGRASA